LTNLSLNVVILTSYVLITYVTGVFSLNAASVGHYCVLQFRTGREANRRAEPADGQNIGVDPDMARRRSVSGSSGVIVWRG
jgi:hypothetical protein